MTEDDRFAGLESRQQEMQRQLVKHGEQIGALNASIPLLRISVDANTKALQEHSKTLNEYSGVRKALHWLATAGAALLAYFFGRHG